MLSLLIVSFRIHNSQKCKGGERLKKNTHSQFTNLNEIVPLKTITFTEVQFTTFITYRNGQLLLVSENVSYSFQQFCISPKIGTYFHTYA